MKNDLLRLLIMVIKRTMYGFAILMVSLTTLIANDGNAQYKSVKDINVTVKLQNATLEDAIREIESKTPFNFTFEEQDILKRTGINVKAKNQSLDLVLLEIAKGAKVEFKQVNSNIHIKSVAMNIEVMQGRTITGKITSSEDQQGLPGANVIVKGTSTGTVTDIDGNYSLNVPDNGEFLVFSSVGFLTQEIAIGTRSAINIVMQPDVTSLNEIVVIGYGTQEKVNLTGAVGVAKGDVLQERPIANVGEGLQGVIPNLNVNIRNGDPAANVDFNIRGYESINGGSPLILVDGVPMNLNRVNPNDIESISVLKDASAAAVYGARAAFGVVLVETKKGKSGQMNVTFGAEFAAAKPIMFIDPITDPFDFANARNLATTRTDGSAGYNQRQLDLYKRYSDDPSFENSWGVYNNNLEFYGYNDYQEKIITDFAPQQKYDMSISGGTDKASYYVSLGYLSKDGYLKNKDKNENFKRYNILIKGDAQIADWVNLDTRVMLTTEKSNKPHFYNWDVNINTTARQDPLDALTFPDLDHYLTPGDHDDYAEYIACPFSARTSYLIWNKEEGIPLPRMT